MVIISLFVICECCCIPCIQSLCERPIESAIKNEKYGNTAVQMPLLGVEDEEMDDELPKWGIIKE